MKNLNDFVNGYPATLVILKQRYAAGYVAFVGTEELVGEIASALTGGDDESSNITYGLFRTDWYPVGYGRTIEEAVIDLNIRVAAFISDPGMVGLYELAYNVLSNNIFRFDKENRKYVFSPQLSQSNFPDWLKRYSTLTEEKLYQLQEDLIK